MQHKERLMGPADATAEFTKIWHSASEASRAMQRLCGRGSHVINIAGPRRQTSSCVVFLRCAGVRSHSKIHPKWIGSPSVWAQPNEGKKREGLQEGQMLFDWVLFPPRGNKKEQIPGRSTASTESGGYKRFYLIRVIMKRLAGSLSLKKKMSLRRFLPPI